MKGKKLAALGLTAVMTMSLLAGCGGKAEKASGDEPAGGTADESPAAEASADGEAVELELFSTKTENAAILQKMID